MDCDKFTNNSKSATYTYAPGLSDCTKRYDMYNDPVVPTSCDGTTPAPKPTPTPEPGKKIDVISVIDYTNHTHDISATCIQPYNGKLYMSYHTNEENQADPGIERVEERIPAQRVGEPPGGAQIRVAPEH